MMLRRTQESRYRNSRHVEGLAWHVVLLVHLIVCGIGCSGCYQSTVVPPMTSITPPIKSNPEPQPMIPGPTEPVNPPSSYPIDPIRSTNPWKPEADLREWNYIVLHHTASERGNVESIHEEHLKRKDKNGVHWLGIGYHFVIGNGDGMDDGSIEPTFRWRQQLQGAHAGIADYNQHGIGIVLIGNFENTAPSTAQMNAVKQLVGVLKREFGIASGKVMGHGDVKATECPGKLFPLSEVRDTIAFRDEHATNGTTHRDAIRLINLSGESRK